MKAESIKEQLNEIMKRYRLQISSCKYKYNLIRKAITAGFFMNAAKENQKKGSKVLWMANLYPPKFKLIQQTSRVSCLS